MLILQVNTSHSPSPTISNTIPQGSVNKTQYATATLNHRTNSLQLTFYSSSLTFYSFYEHMGMCAEWQGFTVFCHLSYFQKESHVGIIDTSAACALTWTDAQRTIKATPFRHPLSYRLSLSFTNNCYSDWEK